MKAVGLLLLVLAGGGVGVWRALALHRRAASLEAARRLVLWLTARLRYTAAPVGELLQQAAGTEEFRSFSLVPAVVRGLENESLPTAWQRAVMDTEKENNFTEGDSVLLREFGEGLGKTDLAGQQAHGELYAALLADRQQQAVSAARERGRVECVLWLAGAAALALLMV